MYWNNWYSGWGWFLWYGVFFLFFLNLGNWGYTYKAHRRFDDAPSKDAMDFLNERYARGEIDHEEYLRTKSNIFTEREERFKSNRSKRSSASSLQSTYQP